MAIKTTMHHRTDFNCSVSETDPNGTWLYWNSTFVNNCNFSKEDEITLGLDFLYIPFEILLMILICGGNLLVILSISHFKVRCFWSFDGMVSFLYICHVKTVQLCGGSFLLFLLAAVFIGLGRENLKQFNKSVTLFAFLNLNKLRFASDAYLHEMNHKAPAGENHTQTHSKISQNLWKRIL